jgi:ElaB/YqjD/DUF883 family membrane-anchored ribosome-binding protein
MGSRADEAEQRIEEQRRLIERKVEALEERLRDDVGTARERVKERTDEALHALPGVDTIEQQVRERPMATLGGGLALGMVLGMAGQGGSDSRSNGRSRDRRSSNRYEDDSSDGGGVLGSLLAPAMMAITGPVQSELTKMAREALSGLRSASQNGRSGSSGS